MTYAGNKLLNPNNGSFVLILVVFIYALLADTTKSRPVDIDIFGAIVAFMLLLTVWEAFYFEITDTELIVHNYLFGFINLSYRLADITEVKIVGTNYKSTAKAALKVVRDNKRSIAFRSAGLSVADWKALMLELGTRQVEVTLIASSLIDVIDV